MPPRRPALRRPAARRRAAPLVPVAEIARDEWLAIEDGPLESVAIGEKVKMKLSYGGVAGEIVGEVMELTVDALGKWAGVDIRGTTLPALRHWKVSRAGAAGRLFCCRTIVEPEKQVLEEGIGYPSEVMILTGESRDGWARNCKDVDPIGEGQDENAELRALAGDLGFPQGAGGDQPPRAKEGGVEAQRRSEDKKEDDVELVEKVSRSSKRRRVKDMIQKATWDVKGTPLDPKYKREIKVSLRKRKREASSSATSSSGSSGSYGGIGREQELKAVSRKLPGYLTRKAAQEAAASLSQSVGEELKGFQLFVRYYRQAVLPRGGSRPVLREMLTIATALDNLIGGNVLATLDLLSQRLKSLELLQGGADGEVARQLELVPPEAMTLASQEESRFAHSEHSAEQKVRKGLVKQGYQPWSPKGNPKGEGLSTWKGQEKGGKAKGKEKGKATKGKKGEESKVVAVE